MATNPNETAVAEQPESNSEIADAVLEQAAEEVKVAGAEINVDINITFGGGSNPSKHKNGTRLGVGRDNGRPITGNVGCLAEAVGRFEDWQIQSAKGMCSGEGKGAALIGGDLKSCNVSEPNSADSRRVATCAGLKALGR